MIVLLGATLAWVLIGALLGVGIFLMATKAIFWPFIVVFVLCFFAVKSIGCSTH